MASVDVVVPCYQYGRYLRDCVTSVLTQGIADLRVLVIDNASTDDSVEVARRLALEDPRVEVLARRVNLGPHASFNEGIDWASADYFLILCADDLLAPGAVARAVSVMEQHKEVQFAYGRAAMLGQDEAAATAARDGGVHGWDVIEGRQLLERFCRTAVCHIAECAVLIRTEAQKRAGHFRPELPHTDDFEMWMRLALLGHVAETGAMQGALRVHGASRSAMDRHAHTADLANCRAAFESFFAREGAALIDAPRLRAAARRSLSDRAYWSALSHLCRGQAGAGGELFRFAFGLRPRTALAPPLGYLFRREDAFRRIAAVASGGVPWRRADRRGHGRWIFPRRT